MEVVLMHKKHDRNEYVCSVTKYVFVVPHFELSSVTNSDARLRAQRIVCDTSNSSHLSASAGRVQQLQRRARQLVAASSLRNRSSCCQLHLAREGNIAATRYKRQLTADIVAVGFIGRNCCSYERMCYA